MSNRHAINAWTEQVLGDSFNWCWFFLLYHRLFLSRYISLVLELCAPPFSCRFVVVVYTISFLYFFLVKYYFFCKFSKIIVCLVFVGRHIALAVVGSVDSLAHCLLILNLTCPQFEPKSCLFLKLTVLPLQVTILVWLLTVL